MQEWAALVVTVIVSVTATTGFWQLIQRRLDKKDTSAEMLLGLGHDRIIYLGMCYIERGSITQAEYENIEDYLYRPYIKMGGNGSALKIMEEVRKLPIRAISPEEMTHPGYCREHRRLIAALGGINVD